MQPLGVEGEEEEGEEDEAAAAVAVVRRAERWLTMCSDSVRALSRARRCFHCNLIKAAFQP